MNREEIYSLLKDCIVAVVPDVPWDQISPDWSFKQLGADSIDRSDIATALKARLSVEISAFELGKARSLGTLVEHIHGLVCVPKRSSAAWRAALPSAGDGR